MSQDFLEEWPPALRPEEEILFVGSIPRDASAQEIFDIACDEKRRRLNRQAPSEELLRNPGFVLVAVPSHPCGPPHNSEPVQAYAETSPNPPDAKAVHDSAN